MAPTHASRSTTSFGDESNDDVDRDETILAESEAQEVYVVADASLPTASALTALGVIAGWVWTQRKRWFNSSSEIGLREER